MLKLNLQLVFGTALLSGCVAVMPLGDEALQRGDLPTAAGYYSAAAKRGEPGAAQKYAAVLQRQGRTTEAEAVLRQAPQIPLTWTQRVDELVMQGRCNDAREVAATSAPTNGSSAGVSAWITIRCEKNFEAAMPSLNLAARYGNDWARRTLVQNARPVPPADLYQGTPLPVVSQSPPQGQRSNADIWVDILGAVVGGYVAGRQNAQTYSPAKSTDPLFTTCDARRTTMGANVGMNQSYNVNCY